MIIYCNPKIVKLLTEAAEQYTKSIPSFNMRIVACDFLPATQRKPKVVYHDTPFIKYSDGPADKSMTLGEYEKLCIFMDDAHIEYEEHYVAFSIDTGKQTHISLGRHYETIGD